MAVIGAIASSIGPSDLAVREAQRTGRTDLEVSLNTDW